jgi:hypothetical protein
MPDQTPIDPQRLAEIRIRCARALADDPRSPIGEDLQDVLAELDRVTALATQPILADPAPVPCSETWHKWNSPRRPPLNSRQVMVKIDTRQVPAHYHPSKGKWVLPDQEEVVNIIEWRELASK